MSEKNTASLGFEQKIWEAADTLRGNLNAAEYEGKRSYMDVILEIRNRSIG